MFPEIGYRLKILRHVAGYGGPGKAGAFYEKLGFSRAYYHWEQGLSIPWQRAVVIVRSVPGLTLDWLYLNDFRGLTVDLARRLEDARAEVGRRGSDV